MNADAQGFRFLFLVLLATLSLTFRGVVALGQSSFHLSLVYGDLPVILALLFFACLLWLVQGRFPPVRNVATFVPLILLTLWWTLSGFLFAKKGDLFAAALIQAVSGAAAALFLPGILARYGMVSRFLDLFLKVSIAVAGFALYQVAVNPDRLFISATSTLGPNRSYLGLYMMVTFAVAVFRLFQGSGRLPVITMVAAFAAIVVSGSRASQIGCCFILAPYLLSRLSVKNLVRFAVAAAILFAVTDYIGAQREGAHAETQFEISKNVKIDQSAGRRFLIWAATWDVISRSPENFTLGVGFTNYRWEYDRTIKLPFYTNAAHNAYLQVWSETGLVGLVLFLSTLGAIFIRSVMIRRRQRECLALAGLVVGLAFTGLTQETLYPIEAYGNFNTLFFLIAGVMLHPAPSAGATARPCPPEDRPGTVREVFA